MRPAERGNDDKAETLARAIAVHIGQGLIVVDPDRGRGDEVRHFGDMDPVSGANAARITDEIGDRTGDPVALGQLSQQMLIAGQKQIFTCQNVCAQGFDVAEYLFHGGSLL